MNILRLPASYCPCGPNGFSDITFCERTFIMNNEKNNTPENRKNNQPENKKNNAPENKKNNQPENRSNNNAR